MLDYNFEDMDLETNLEEDSDEESARALDDFLKTLGIKNSKDIPALKEASQRVKVILKKYCSTGNKQVRLSKVIEFYKCLDWLPFQEMDTSFLNKFTENDKKILLKEIHIYLNKKEEKLERSHKWREEYKQRIWDYYKEKVPKAIKLELERLRDYELNLVGHDRNWQYYFHFQSFKKIDNFIAFTASEKSEIYSKFKSDVLSYKNNRDRNLSSQQTTTSNCKHWDDDIIKNINWEKNTQKQENYKQVKTPDTSMGDYTTLEVPFGADLTTIKKQYRKLAKLYHPDRPDGNETKMKQIVAAYHRLISK